MEWWAVLLIVLGCVVLWLLLSALFYRPFFKRFYDIVLSGIAILVFALPLAIVALGVLISMGRPVLFHSERVTKNEKRFHLLKFRSMKNAFDKDGVPLPDSERMTRFGNFIRKTSLDELPSLFNIFKGEMSIVGPRPLPLNYLPWFKREERKRFSIRAGLTGLAQVNGRGELGWEKKFSYDCEYNDSYSFFGDILIILKTVINVFKRADIGSRGNNSPADFHCYRSGLTEKELMVLEKEGKLPIDYEAWLNEKTINA